MSTILEINDNLFVVNGRIQQGYVSRLSPSFRTIGVQQRDDDSSVNRYPNPAWPLGLGWARAKRDSGRGVGGLKDSTAWTAIGPVTLGKLQETQTHASVADHFKKAVNFKGDLWGIFEEDSSGSRDLLVSRKFGATSDDWTGGSTVHTSAVNGNIPTGQDLVVHKSSMFVLRTETISPPTKNIYKVDSSTDGATWNDASGTGWPDTTATHDYIPGTILQRQLFNDDLGRLLPFGNVLLAAIWRHIDSSDGDGTIEVLSTTDSGSNWASGVTIPSGDGPKALVDWYDLDGNRAPVLITAEGIYSIDTSASTFETIRELDGDPANGRFARVAGNGKLYVGLGTGKVLVLDITSTGHLTSFVSGPGGDGLVTARQGHVTFMLPVDGWMLVGYGGHAASTFASIFMIDTQTVLEDPESKKLFNPWHHMWEDTTGNLDIVAMAYSTEDDSTARLHFAVEGNDASINYHIEEPFANPLESTTVKYQLTSVLRLPDDDLGDPQSTSTMLQMLVDADDLTAGSGGSGGSGDEFITPRYGLDGASDTTVTREDFLSGTLTRPFGAFGSITAFADADGGQVTVTSASHGLANGNIVTITGTTSYNGTFTIANVSTNDYEITDTFVADDGTGTWIHPVGVAGRRIGINLLLDRSTTETNRPILNEFELQAQHVYTDKERYEFVIDIDKSIPFFTKTANTDPHETVIAAILAIGVSETLVTYTAGGATQRRVKVPHNEQPVLDLEVRGADVSNRGYRTGFATMVLEEGI